MNGNSDRTQAEPDVFRALLTPHRSLGPTGFLVLMAALSAVSFVAGVAFLLMGAWPVLGFFGLDVLLVYIAFRLNYRSGRRLETLEITPARFVLTRFHPSGRQERFCCDPYWARVSLREWSDGRTALSVVSRGTELKLGCFLTDDERRDLASALREALLTARGGVRI